MVMLYAAACMISNYVQSYYCWLVHSLSQYTIADAQNAPCLIHHMPHSQIVSKSESSSRLTRLSHHHISNDDEPVRIALYKTLVPLTVGQLTDG
jgi:hypothetical protein